MKQNITSRFWVRLLCWILAGLMLTSTATYFLYLLFGLF